MKKKTKKPDIFAKVKNRTYVRRIPGGIIFYWSRKFVGWGAVTLRVTRGKLTIDDECMGINFCAEVIKTAMKQAKKT